MDELKFREWLIEHSPDEKMIWEPEYWKAYVFWYNKILPMYTDEFHRKNKDFDNIIREINCNTEIIGTHISKSIINPVARIIYHGFAIVFRYNYYDYEIAVIGRKPVNIPMKNLFSSKSERFMYQGFPDEYIVSERYEDSKCRFVAKVRDHYDFYTFMYLLQKEIYINTKHDGGRKQCHIEKSDT